jgi:hypothetical protein
MIVLLLLLQEFTAVDVYVESPKPLAAWQLELRTAASIVGVEGGEPKCYAEPPFYDPKALQGGRIVLAAFTTEAAPPSGRIRVARLHLRGAPELSAREIVAAAPGGARMDVKVELTRAK